MKGFIIKKTGKVSMTKPNQENGWCVEDALFSFFGLQKLQLGRHFLPDFEFDPVMGFLFYKKTCEIEWDKKVIIFSWK